MIRALALALAAPLVVAAGPGMVIDRPELVQPIRVQMDGVPTGVLVTMLMRDVFRVPYVISSDILADRSPISVNLVMPREQVPVRIVAFLRSVGLTVSLRGGTVYVTKGDPGGVAGDGFAAQPMPGQVTASSGPAQPPLPVPPQAVLVVRLAHRSTVEMLDLLSPALPDLTFSARGDVEPADATSIASTFDPDALVLAGSKSSLDRAEALIRLLDRPRPVVELRAVVMQVRTNSTSSSALSLLAQVGGFSVSSEAPAVPGQQFIRLATGGLQALLSATRGDGRFQVVAEPTLSAMSGTVARLNSGSQVPTVGAVSYAENGQPVRSIVYRDSGLSLSVRPVVRPGAIDLAVEQERSAFERTTTGVNDSPTLVRSSTSSRLVVAPGETVAIAGLEERSSGSSRTGFFGGLLGGRQREEGQAQLVVLIEARLAEVTGEVATPTFDRVSS